MNFGVLIQARISSKRLNAKMLMDFLGTKLVDYVYQRCKQSKKAKIVSIITSNDATDDQLAEYCYNQKINVFRGNLNNVLMRYVDASKKLELDYVVRVCGDSPFVDVNIIDEMVSLAESSPELDYIACDKTKILWGLDSELIKVKTLNSLLNKRLDDQDLEHVTLFIRNNIEKYSHKLIKSFFPKDLVKKYKFTVDTKDDFDRCINLGRGLNGFKFSSQDIFELIHRL